jgi:hypothetical protein
MTTQFTSDLREAVKNHDEGIFAVYDGCVAAADLLSNIYSQPRVGKVSGRIIQDEIRRLRIRADAAAILIERMPPSDERARVLREATEQRIRAA